MRIPAAALLALSLSLAACDRGPAATPYGGVLGDDGGPSGTQIAPRNQQRNPECAIASDLSPDPCAPAAPGARG
jgi:hypothetical protein